MEPEEAIAVDVEPRHAAAHARLPAEGDVPPRLAIRVHLVRVRDRGRVRGRDWVRVRVSYMLVCDVELGNPLETTSAN